MIGETLYSQTHCWFHCLETVDEFTYIVCGECGHAWSKESLLTEHNKVLRELTEIEHVEPGVRETDPDMIPACPLCIHDF